MTEVVRSLVVINNISRRLLRPLSRLRQQEAAVHAARVCAAHTDVLHEDVRRVHWCECRLSYLTPHRKLTISCLVGCQDLSADCVKKTQLCNMSAYTDLMSQYCQKTCDLCGGEHCVEIVKRAELEDEPQSLDQLSNSFPTQRRLRDYSDCYDDSYDCVNKPQLCADPAYTDLMSTYCKKTCNMCDRQCFLLPFTH